MTRSGRKKTLNFTFDDPLESARLRAPRTDSVYYTLIRRKEGGYDRNFANTASGRVSIAISRLTACSLLAVLHDEAHTAVGEVVSRYVG